MSCSVIYCDGNSNEYYECTRGHKIHKECAREWAHRVPDDYKCPMCRAYMIPTSILSENEYRQARALQGRVDTPEEAITLADQAIAEADRHIANKRKYTWGEIAEIVALIPPVWAFINWADGNN